MKKAIIEMSYDAKVQVGIVLVKNLKHYVLEAAEMTISDGYHTIDELYEHRATLFIALCRLITDYFPKRENMDAELKMEVWRSRRHSDGSKFDGWFVLGIGKEAGNQITYHLPDEKWAETEFAETLNNAPDFDGHTSDDVLAHLKLL